MTTPTSALWAPAASGAFEVAVEDLFLSSSRAVETPGPAGRALQLLRGAASEKVGVRSPCAPYGAFRRPPSVGQVDGSALLQYLIDYLAGLTFFHGLTVPNAVLPMVGTAISQRSLPRRCRVGAACARSSPVLGGPLTWITDGLPPVYLVSAPSVSSSSEYHQTMPSSIRPCMLLSFRALATAAWAGCPVNRVM